MVYFIKTAVEREYVIETTSNHDHVKMMGFDVSL